MPNEDVYKAAYEQSVQTVGSLRALVEVLQNDLTKEREERRLEAAQHAELRKTLHMSRVGAMVGNAGRPVITVVTTIRNHKGMTSVCTLVDEYNIYASKRPEIQFEGELRGHIMQGMDQFFKSGGEK